MPILAEFDSKTKLSIDFLQIEHTYLEREWNYTLCDNFSRIYFIMDGEGTVYAEKEKVVLKPGFIYIIPAMYPFRCRCDSHLEKIFAHARCNILPNRDLLANLEKIAVLPCPQEQMQELSALLRENGIYAQLRIRIILETVILSQLKGLEAAFEYDYSLYRKFESFFYYTNNHIYAGISIDEICRNINMTPRQLSYQYKTATGQSVKSYLNVLLIDRIKHYLITTDRSLQSISDELQFSNEFYCSRFFKKGTGVSPREYRQMHTEYRKTPVPPEKAEGRALGGLE